MSAIPTVIQAARAAKAKYDSVKALKKECRTAWNVAETVIEVCEKIEAGLAGRPPPAGAVGPLQSLHQGVLDLDELITICRDKPAQAALFSQTYQRRLWTATRGIHDAIGLLRDAEIGLGLQIQRDVEEAQSDLGEVLESIENLRDELGSELRGVVRESLVPALRRKGLAHDDADARRQIEELLSELSLSGLANPPPVPMPEIPDEFKCPLTLGVMRDPVLLCTDAGHAYERTALEQCLTLHPNRDPMSNIEYAEPLRYAPNRPLREAIERWRTSPTVDVDGSRRREEAERRRHVQREREKAERGPCDQAERDRQRAERDYNRWPWLRQFDNDNTLTILDLRGNSIGVEGAARLATALERNATLTTLDLGSNNIGVEGAARLATTLERNATLTTLDLGFDDVGNEGAARLATALERNNTLTKLDLGSNDIGVEGAARLATTLERNATLTTLHLDSNNIGNQGAARLATALERNNTLRDLSLGGNDINYNTRSRLTALATQKGMKIDC